MFRRKALIPLAGAFMTVGVFMVTEAMATLNACSDFTVTLQGGKCAPVAGTDKEVCTFGISGGGQALSKISHAEFAPSALLKASVVAGDESNVTVSGMGDGGIGSFSYAKQIPAVDVVTITSFLIQSGGPVRFEVTGSGGNIGKIGVHTKAGNKEEVCTVDGPIPPPPLSSFARASAECINLVADGPFGPDDTSILIQRDASTNCINSMIAHTVPDCEGDPTQGETMEVIGEQSSVILASGLRRDVCPEAVIIDEGSPFYLYQTNSGGMEYKYCIDLATGKFTSLSNCGV